MLTQGASCEPVSHDWNPRDQRATSSPHERKGEENPPQRGERDQAWESDRVDGGDGDRGGDS